MNLQLSYIIATRNRLAFLKITLQKLIGELQPDEEIVAVDGDSTDGSKEYLQRLFDEGKIHQFISEPDENQAHAWNKAMLMAKGSIIKKIIDDDVFCYSAIRTCKNFMLSNPDVDVVISNDLACDLSNHKKINQSSRQPQFEKWRNGVNPSFTFGDVHMLIRRSSLGRLGLYNTCYIMMDWEYSLRISYMQANIVYYTGYNALSVSHAESVSASKNAEIATKQGERGAIFYEYKGDRGNIGLWSKIKIGAGKLLKPPGKKGISVKEGAFNDLDSVYTYLYQYISELNHSLDFTFRQNA
ncbi:MAG: glycosyltransferase [Bacteroidota bacterium]|nr:glycosyltransferase [Bacteroidota bacterium]